MRSDAKNLEAICRAIAHHNSACDFPATAILMNPFEVERLGWEDVMGVPVHADENISTGRFEIFCDGQDNDLDHAEEVEEVVDAVQPLTERILVPA